jgi:hypothetical protein
MALMTGDFETLAPVSRSKTLLLVAASAMGNALRLAQADEIQRNRASASRAAFRPGNAVA